MKDIRTKNEKELTESITAARGRLRELRFGASGSKVRNVKEARELRKQVARGMTEQSRRQQTAE